MGAGSHWHLKPAQPIENTARAPVDNTATCMTKWSSAKQVLLYHLGNVSAGNNCIQPENLYQAQLHTAIPSRHAASMHAFSKPAFRNMHQAGMHHTSMHCRMHVLLFHLHQAMQACTVICIICIMKVTPALLLSLSLADQWGTCRPLQPPFSVRVPL